MKKICTYPISPIVQLQHLIKSFFKLQPLVSWSTKRFMFAIPLTLLLRLNLIKRIGFLDYILRIQCGKSIKPSMLSADDWKVTHEKQNKYPFSIESFSCLAPKSIWDKFNFHQFILIKRLYFRIFKLIKSFFLSLYYFSFHSLVIRIHRTYYPFVGNLNCWKKIKKVLIALWYN